MPGQWVLVAGKRQAARPRGLQLHVSKERRPPNAQDPFATAYRSHMSDGASRESWAEYLRRMTARPGWSVARLARESGVHRSTLFRWIAGSGGANVTSVRAIAKALGDDPSNALRAAGNMPGEAEQALHPDLQYLQRRLTDPNVSPAEKAAIETALRYLAEVTENAEQAERPGRTLRRRNAS